MGATIVDIRPQLRKRNERAAESCFTQGFDLNELGNKRAAKEAYRRCLDLDPFCREAHINLGTLLYDERDFTRAEWHYRQATLLDPEYALAWFNLGNAFDEQWRFQEAGDAYRKALSLAPDYADAHYNLALIYERQGFNWGAILEWRHYLRCDQTGPFMDSARLHLNDALVGERLKLLPR